MNCFLTQSALIGLQAAQLGVYIYSSFSYQKCRKTSLMHQILDTLLKKERNGKKKKKASLPAGFEPRNYGS